MRKSIFALFSETAWVSLIVSAIYGVLLGLRSGSFIVFMLVALIGWPVCWVIIVMTEWLGEQRHRTIIESTAFMWLQKTYGFEIERYNNGRYYGLIGIFQGTAIRVYYDWNSSSGIRGKEKTINIHVYYEPLWVNDDSLDVDRLDALNKKYRTRWWQTKTRRFMKIEGASLIYYQSNTRFRAKKTMEKALRHGIELMQREGLKAISIERVHELTALDFYMFGTEVESFLETVEEGIVNE